MDRHTTPEASTPNYTMGYSPEFLQLLERRNAAVAAAHLLPRLERGMRLLDLGCGPGTISVGLAEAVAPGEVHAIDMEETQIDMARAAARAGGHENAFFRTGDATALPFEDSSFDVVHCHALLNHAPATQAVLAEAMRVLKPGGLIAARELVGDSSFVEPEHYLGAIGGAEGGAWMTFLKLLAANGGHPQMGKELKRAFADTGFVDIHATASFETFTSAEDLTFLRGLIDGWFFAPVTMGAAIKLGLATQDAFDGWRDGLDRWKTEPGAFAAFAWGEAIGRKP